MKNHTEASELTPETFRRLQTECIALRGSRWSYDRKRSVTLSEILDIIFIPEWMKQPRFSAGLE
jgi:hypothetical protein